MAYEGVIGGDEWDQIPDDQLEETFSERLWGLTEMFPETLRTAVCKSVNWSVWATQSSFSLMKSGLWVVATTSMIMFLPYIIEKERADLEKSQVAQQRQLLLGPSAAVSAATKH